MSVHNEDGSKWDFYTAQNNDDEYVYNVPSMAVASGE